MTASEYLRQYEYAYYAAERARQTYELEMERIDAIGSTLGENAGMPRGSGISRSTEARAIRLAEKAGAWLDAEEKAQTVLEEVVNFINLIPGIEGVALYQRYVMMLGWKEIADNLLYTESGIFKVRDRAMAIAERMLNSESN